MAVTEIQGIKHWKNAYFIEVLRFLFSHSVDRSLLTNMCVKTAMSFQRGWNVCCPARTHLGLVMVGLTGRVSQLQWIKMSSLTAVSGQIGVSYLEPSAPTQSSLLWNLQFSSVAQSCLTLCDPMDCSMPCFPVHHQLLEFIQTHVHWVSDAIQSSHPLSSPSHPAFNLSQNQGLFKWETRRELANQDIYIEAKFSDWYIPRIINSEYMC